MPEDRITWYPAGKPKRSGMLEHKFTASGPHAQAVWDWLDQDNQRHGEWLLPQAPAGEHFAFRIHENPQDPAAARRTRGHIAHLKLTGAAVQDLEWHEHGQA